MTDLTLVGTAMLGFATLGGCYVLGTHITAKAQARREQIEARFEKRYEDKCRESDGWRMAFEQARIENAQLKARLEIQNRIYGKTKVRELKK